MNSSIGPTEDVFQELLKHFVAPLLRNEASGNHLPSISLQNSVAKQMHAVVLLYNYFHRKHHPALELLGFESCCKLAVIMEPSLIMHMKLMQLSDNIKEDDRDSQLSITEKAIMDACDVSSALDANKDVPNMGGWPISKVTVLLVDSKKENCLLLFSSITRGIWSVVEKDIDASNNNSGSSINQKPKSYRRKSSSMLHRDELHTYDGDLQKLAISAVEEISGINQTDIMVLESHIAYSLSKEKTVARFFILQTSQLISEDLQVPVKDLIESLQGPLVQKKSYGWRLTPVVNYFHVLPYATILSDWISRELLSKSLGEKNKIDCIYTKSSYKAEDQQMAEVNEERSISNKHLSAIDAVGNGAFTGNGESPKKNTINGCLPSCLYNTGRSFKLDVDKSSLFSIHSGDKSRETLNAVTVDNHILIANSMDCCKNTATRGISNGNLNCSSEKPKDKNKGLREMTYFSNSGNEPRKIDVDKPFLVRTNTENKIKNSSNAVEINNPKNEKTVSMDIDQDGAISCADLMAEMIDSPVEFLITETTPAELNIQNRNCRTSSSGGDLMALEDRSFSPHQLNPKSNPMLIQASKEDALSQTALKVLHKKRETLSLKLRDLEDELAMCDKHIQKILNGGEDDLALKIQTLVDSYNDVFMNRNNESQNFACQVGEEQSALCTKRKRLSDAIFTLKTPCQELDAICCVNNWILPTYSLSSPNDGFLATINVKGGDFELSEQSDLSSSPHEARESAAAKMVASLKLKVSHRIAADTQV